MNHILSPEEIRRNKLARKPIRLTILVCGQSSTGKKTFINTLCNYPNLIHVNSNSPGALASSSVLDDYGSSVDNQNTSMLMGNNDLMSIQKHHLEINEPNSSPISLNVVLTPGFGEAINNNKCCFQIVDYLENQYNLILQEECKIKRNPKFTDGRIHVALYFIRPTSKGLDQLDIESMKVLSKRVNLIPVLSKADMMTKDELALNKKLIMRDIRLNGIQVYDFNRKDTDLDLAADDSETERIVIQSAAVSGGDSSSDDSYLNDLLPFAVIGSNTTKTLDDGRIMHLRRYGWAEINVEDPDVCDFNALKTVLFGSHIQEFKDVTHNVLYERFRTEKLLTRNMYAEYNK